jgi:hypothetical protein
VHLRPRETEAREPTNELVSQLVIGADPRLGLAADGRASRRGCRDVTSGLARGKVDAALDVLAPEGPLGFEHVMDLAANAKSSVARSTIKRRSGRARHGVPASGRPAAL